LLVRAETEQTPNAVQQTSATRGQRPADRRRTQLFQGCQGLRVIDAIPAPGDGHVIATVLPFLAHPLGYPPHRRMIEQQRFQQALQPINQVIIAPDVRQFMR